MYDVAIIGAGPGGLSTALSLSINLRESDKEDISIVIIDREKIPGKNKPCGGMILYPALKLIPALSRIAAREIHGVRIFYRNMRYDVDFNEIVAINVDRAKLSSFFMDKLREGVELLLGENVKDVYMRNNDFEIRTMNKIIRTKFLVGADGVNSVVRRKIFRYIPKRDDIGLTHQIWAKMNKSEIDHKINNFNEFYYGKFFSPGGYSWIFPHEDFIKIGVGSIATKIRGKISSYLRNVIRYRGLNNLEIIREEYYSVPLSGGLKNIVKGRAILVGDAAHQVEPISGTGIHLAIINGLILGSILGRVFLNKQKYLDKYEKVWNTIYRRELLIQKLLVKLLLRYGSRLIRKDSGSNETIKKFAEILVGKSRSIELIKGWLKTKFLEKR